MSDTTIDTEPAPPLTFTEKVRADIKNMPAGPAKRAAKKWLADNSDDLEDRKDATSVSPGDVFMRGRRFCVVLSTGEVVDPCIAILDEGAGTWRVRTFDPTNEVETGAKLPTSVKAPAFRKLT